MPTSASGRQRHAWILLQGAHRAEQEDRHCDREGGILRVHEHMAVVERTGGEQRERHKPRERPARSPADAPRDQESDNSHRRANQAAGLEQRERQQLGGERRKQVEATAVIVQVHPRQRALVAEARGVELEQQIAVFGVGVVVPTQTVVAKRQKREDAHNPHDQESERIQDAARRQLRGRGRGDRRHEGHGIWVGFRSVEHLATDHGAICRWQWGRRRADGDMGASVASAPERRQDYPPSNDLGC